MNINGAFGGDYLKAADLQNKPVTLIMGKVEMAVMKDPRTGSEEQKPILQFQGTDRSLVLNKTNANIIAACFSDETEAWFGQKIELYPTTTEFGGKIVPCIRVRRPDGPVQQQHIPSAAVNQPIEQNTGQSAPPAYHDGPIEPMPWD